jgi:hypothetical protein
MEVNKPGGSWGGCLTMIILYALAAVVYQGWLWTDRAGLRSHTVDSVITVQGDWIPGETKLCASAPMTGEEGRQAGKPTGYVFGRISCDNGPDHNVKIEFYGKEAQPKLTASAYWSCTRNSISMFNDEAFTCKQTGGM